MSELEQQMQEIGRAMHLLSGVNATPNKVRLRDWEGISEDSISFAKKALSFSRDVVTSIVNTYTEPFKQEARAELGTPTELRLLNTQEFLGELATTTMTFPGIRVATGLADAGYRLATDPSALNVAFAGAELLGLRGENQAIRRLSVGSKQIHIGATQLREAEYLLASGKYNAEAIRAKTGWYQDPMNNNRWTFEVDTSDIHIDYRRIERWGEQFKHGGNISPLLLEDIISGKTAEALFNAYPQLRYITMSNLDLETILGEGGLSPTLRPGTVPGSSGSGQYRASLNEIDIYARQGDEFATTLIHEIQHAIQNLEGWQKGGTNTVDFTQEELRSALSRLENDAVYSSKVETYYKVLNENFGDSGTLPSDTLDVESLFVADPDFGTEDFQAALDHAQDWFKAEHNFLDSSRINDDRIVFHSLSQKLGVLNRLVRDVNGARAERALASGEIKYTKFMDDKGISTLDQKVIEEFMDREYRQLFGEIQARQAEWSHLVSLHGWAKESPLEQRASMLRAENQARKQANRLPLVPNTSGINIPARVSAAVTDNAHVPSAPISARRAVQPEGEDLGEALEEALSGQITNQQNSIALQLVADKQFGEQLAALIEQQVKAQLQEEN